MPYASIDDFKMFYDVRGEGEAGTWRLDRGEVKRDSAARFGDETGNKRSMTENTNTSDCIFCRIIRGELDAAIIYEDESTVAFLDLRQSNEGHVLVVPRHHVEQIYDLDEDTACALAGTVCKVSRAVRRVYAPEGLSIWQSNGPAAFQEVPHVHWHIFPRYTDDGHLVVYPKELAGRARREYSLESLKNIADPLICALEDEDA